MKACSPIIIRFLIPLGIFALNFFIEFFSTFPLSVNGLVSWTFCHLYIGGLSVSSFSVSRKMVIVETKTSK